MLYCHLGDDCGLMEGCEVFVSDYSDGGWDGYGFGLGLVNGEVYGYDLGHCSCYGPLDNGGECLGSFEEFVKSNDVLSLGKYSSIYGKFVELVESLN